MTVAVLTLMLPISVDLNVYYYKRQQEAQLMLTTGSTRLAVNQGQQT